MAAPAPLPRPTFLDDVPVAPPSAWDASTRWYAYDATEVDNEVGQAACEAGLAVDVLHSASHTDGGKGSDKLLGAWTLRERWAYFRDAPNVYSRLCAIPDSIQAGRRFMVIDIDYLKPGFDHDRRVVLESALSMTGIDVHRCPTVRTPSGGVHYWVRIDPDNPQWRGTLTFKTPGLDLIADNQHVCIPPTAGYVFERPIPDSTDPAYLQIPAITPDIYLRLRTAIEVHKPGRALGDRPTGSAPGRNEWCNRFLYRTCNAALRGLPDESMRKLAHDRAQMEWEEMLCAMELEQNRPRSDWNISDTDFDRAWAKAIAIQEQARALGVEWVDDMLWAWWDEPRKGAERETGRFALISQPVASFAKQTVIAGPPDAPPIDRGHGTLIRFLNGETAFLPRLTPSKNQVEQALGSAMLGDHAKAMYKTPNGYQAWQALRMVSADLAQDNHAIQLPTGVWWKDEFPREYASIVPQAPWAFYGLPEGPYVPGDQHETRTGFYPLTAEWVSSANASAIPPWTPPEVGQTSNTALLSSFLRTLAGFQYPDVASPACALVTYGLMRGWLSRMIEQLPMIVIEGPSETGKSKGIFQAVWQLAGSHASTPSVAEARASMTLSNCGYVVMDDVDFSGRERDKWQELFRQQQNRQRNSNMTGNRYLLACMVSISEGFPFYRDKAINNRILRIVVTDRLRGRMSLLTPTKPQMVDLWQVSDRECTKHRGELTRRCLHALSMAENPERDCEAVLDWWAETASSSRRQQYGHAAIELALRVFCWMAQGSDPGVSWYAADYDASFLLDDGSTIDLVQVFRQQYGSATAEEVKEQVRMENPLYFALAEYFKSMGMGMAWDWVRTGMPGVDLGSGTQDARRSWVADKAAWRNSSGRICFRVQRLYEWAQTYRGFADGTRKNLLSMMQFNEAVRKLMETDQITGKMTQYGVQYRSLSADESEGFLRTHMGLLIVDRESLDALVDEDEGMLDL